MENFDQKTNHDIKIEMVRERVQKIRKFYTHLFIYAIGVIIYVLKTYFGVPFNFWPIHFINEFFMWCWTFIIAMQALRLFFREQFFGTNWEQRKIKQLLEKENNNKKWE